MLDALTYQEMLSSIAHNSERHGTEKDIIGVLFTKPDLPIGRDILNSLEYFHFRTGKSVNFYLPGYGAYWNNTYPDGKAVIKIGGAKWYFSNEMFVKFREEFERYCKWEYSGESEILRIEYKEHKLSYEKVMRFYLDQMIRDHVIDSVHSFLKICLDYVKTKTHWLKLVILLEWRRKNKLSRSIF